MGSRSEIDRVDDRSTWHATSSEEKHERERAGAQGPPFGVREVCQDASMSKEGAGGSGPGMGRCVEAAAWTWEGMGRAAGADDASTWCSVGNKTNVASAPIQFGSVSPSVLGAVHGRSASEGATETTPPVHQAHATQQLQQQQQQQQQQRHVPPYHPGMGPVPFVPHSMPMMAHNSGPPSPYMRSGPPPPMGQPMYPMQGTGGMSMPPPHMSMPSGSVPATTKAQLEKPKSKVLKIVNPDTKEEVTIARPKPTEAPKQEKPSEGERKPATGLAAQPTPLQTDTAPKPHSGLTASKPQPLPIVPPKTQPGKPADREAQRPANFAQMAKAPPAVPKPMYTAASGASTVPADASMEKSSSTVPAQAPKSSTSGSKVEPAPAKPQVQTLKMEPKKELSAGEVKPPSFAAAASKQPAQPPPPIARQAASKHPAPVAKDSGKDHSKEKGERRKDRPERHDRTDRPDRRQMEHGGRGRERSSAEARKDHKAVEKEGHSEKAPHYTAATPTSQTAPLAQGAWKQGSVAHIMKQHAERKASEDAHVTATVSKGPTTEEMQTKDVHKRRVHEPVKKRAEEDLKIGSGGKAGVGSEKKERDLSTKHADSKAHQHMAEKSRAREQVAAEAAVSQKKAAAEKAAAEKAAAEKAAAEKAAAETAAAEKAAAEKAAAEKAAAEKAAAEKAAAEKAAAEKAAAEKLAADRAAAEKAALERKEAERKAMAEKAAAVRAIAEKASLKAAMAASGEVPKKSGPTRPAPEEKSPRGESQPVLQTGAISAADSTPPNNQQRAEENSCFYSREFLLSFREKCTTPPSQLPLELTAIANPEGTVLGSGQGPRDESNKWAKGSGGSRRGVPPIPGVPGGSRGGQGSRRSGGGGGDKWERGKSLPSLKDSGPAPVVHKAKNAYKVGIVTDEMETKKRKIMSILNKLTPQNFDKLIAQLKEIEYTDAHTLNALIDEIFEKALAEPTFCGMYAGACQCLAEDMPTFINEETEQEVTFKAVLLGKCEMEFKGEEAVKSPSTDTQTKEATAEEKSAEGTEAGEAEEKIAADVASKKESSDNAKEDAKKALLEEEGKRRAKQRMLGNIRFIGELFKKDMLTERIMHECIRKLLGDIENPDEEDVEALCKLMTTIGEQLDHPKARKHMIAYFQRIETLSENRNISSRVRFMLKDVIELRMDNWKHRRVVEGPKKIEEVHRDAKMQAAGMGGGFGNRDSMRRGGPPRRDDRRGSDFGPPPGRGPPIGSMFERSGSGSGRFGRSNTGPSGRRSGDSDATPRTMNREEVLSKVPSAGSLPLRPGGPMMSHARGGAEGVSLRPSAPPSVGSAAAAVAAKAAAAAPDAERALAAMQNRDRPAESPQNKPKGTQSADKQIPPQPTMSEEKLKQKSKALAEEFYGARDRGEARLCVEEIRSANSDFIPQMIEQWLLDALESKGRDWNVLFELFKCLLEGTQEKPACLEGREILSGLRLLLDQMEDMSVDVPLAPKHIGRLAGQLCGLERTFELGGFVQEVKEAGIEGEGEGQLIDAFIAADIIAAALSGLSSQAGYETAKAAWSDLNMDLSDLLPETVKTSQGVTEAEVQKVAAKFGITALLKGGTEVELYLKDAIEKKTDPGVLCDWFEKNVDESLKDSSKFAFDVSKLVLDSAVKEAETNPENIRQEWPDELLFIVDDERGYWKFLRTMFGSKSKSGQMPCVQAALACYGEHQCHAGLMKRLLMDLYYTDVILEETLVAWREGADASDIKQRAVSDAAEWLDWLAKQEEEGSEGGTSSSAP